jgi:hypothetical protein
MKSNVSMHIKEGSLKKIIAEYTPNDYFVILVALRSLYNNEEEPLINREIAKRLYDLELKRIEE